MMIIIPARWHSRRLPGKPLLSISGVALLDRVLHLAHAAAGDAMPVLVATDDQRVVDHRRQRGQDCVLSDPAITSGSGRALAAAWTLATRPAHVINLQGDAPFMPVAAIAAVIGALREGHRVVTPVVRLSWPALDILRQQKACSPFSGTTCVRSSSGQAYWFSKTIIPAIRDEQERRRTEPSSPVFQHLGLYGYDLVSLEKFERAEPSTYETIEQLEQLRFFSLGIPVQTVEVSQPGISMSGIDSPEDVAVAEALIRRHGDPMQR